MESRNISRAIVILLLAGLSVSVHGQTKNSIRSLVEAVANNDIAAVKTLIAAGAPLTPPDNHRDSLFGYPAPLSVAVENKNIDMAKLLISHGADVNFPKKLSPSVNGTPLHRAAMQGNLEMMTLLLASGADIDRHEGLWHTPLWHAIYSSPSTHVLATVNLLVERGADINIRMKTRVPTFWAKKGDGKWMKERRDCMATALHAVVSVTEDVELLDALIRKGADLSVKDNLRRTPLQCAQERLSIIQVPTLKPKVQAMIDLLSNAESEKKRKAHR